MADKRKVLFQGNELEVDSDYGVDEIREALSQLFPAIEHADATEREDGSIAFEVRSGTKG